MAPSKTKTISLDLQTVFSIANLVKVIGIAVVSFVVVWLNSSYVSIQKHSALEQRVFVLEQRTTSADKQLDSVMVMLKNIDLRISSLITPAGTVIYTDKIMKMETDIESMKKDIMYIRENVKR